MTRMSKQGERRARSPRKHKAPSPKSGPKKDALPLGYKSHDNTLSEGGRFIPKIRGVQ